MRLLITGGAGFIGANFVALAASRGHQMVVLDKLTYAGNLRNLESVSKDQVRFVKGDICEPEVINRLLVHGIDGAPFEALLNFAAESHVDRSIAQAEAFAKTNVFGTTVLLEQARSHHVPRFIQISTDEVYGSIPAGYSSRTTDRLNPSSPYAASKASADLFALSFFKTHGYDVRITRCTNNYGRYQYPEKLIPTIITQARKNLSIPIFGDGNFYRDWIYVDDHCEGLLRVLEAGRAGEIYHFGGSQEAQNLQIVNKVIARIAKNKRNEEVLQELITHVGDRPGHDRRYSLDWSSTQEELGWAPVMGLSEGLSKTVDWYLGHPDWFDNRSA